MTLHQYRAAFGRCISCGEKQMGLRYVKSALAFEGKNDEYANDLKARLPLLLAYAQERTRIARKEELSASMSRNIQARAAIAAQGGAE